MHTVTIKNSHIKWKNHLPDAFVFLWFITLTLYLSQQRSFPYIYADEYGVLGASAVFAGLDWSTPVDMAFYGFLLSIFTFPLYWLDLEPTTLYQSVLAVNAVLVATSAMLALRTIRLSPGIHSETLQIGITIAGFSYPAVLHYSSLALGETALLFCFCLIAYHLTVLLNTNQTRLFNAILLGVGIGLAQYAHPRGVAFVIAGIVVVLYALRARSISQKQFIIIAVSAALSILLLASLKSHLLTTFYIHEYKSGSLLSFIDSKSALLSIDGFIQLAQVSFGQIIYLLTSSFGLLIPGLAILAYTTWKNIQDREMRLKPNANQSINNTCGLLSGFVLISFIVMFAASTMQMLGATRADHYFYGRYNEVMLPALIITSLIYLAHLPKKYVLQWIIVSFFITLLSATAIRLYPEPIFQHTTVWSNITSWLVHVHGPWEINPKYILGGTFTAFMVLAISVLVSKRLFIVVLAAFFTSTAFHNFERQHKGADKSWKTFNELHNKLSSTMSNLQINLIESDWTSFNKGEALQFAFPNAHVQFDNKNLSSADAVLDDKGNYCNDKNTVAYLNKASLCITNESLRKQINITSALLHLESRKGRPKLAAIIETPEIFKLDGIELGSIDRICALATKGYYTSWFRYCLPSIDITITQQGLSGNENHQLGIFVTDSSGNWLQEWRVKLNNQELARNNSVQVTSSIQIPAKISKGEYLLNIAAIDDYGWDWREVEKIKLTVK